MIGVYKRNSGAEASRKLAVLKRLQNLRYEEKIELSRQVIDRAFKIGKPALLYSGGKDSTVLLHLLLEKDPGILIIHNDTTLGDPACLEFIRRVTAGHNYIETTAADPVAMWQKLGHFPILSKRGHTAYKKRIPGLRVSPVQCCYNLKEKYSNGILRSQEVKVVFWGNRAGESNRRKLSFIDAGFLFKPVRYPWHQAYPLQHWLESDITAYLRHDVPDYPESKTFENGCLCCAVDITFRKNNLSNLFERDREKWEYYMRAGFAREILKIKGHGILTDEEIERVIQEKPEYLNHA